MADPITPQKFSDTDTAQFFLDPNTFLINHVKSKTPFDLNVNGALDLSDSQLSESSGLSFKPSLLADAYFPFLQNESVGAVGNVNLQGGQPFQGFLGLSAKGLASLTIGQGIRNQEVLKPLFLNQPDDRALSIPSDSDSELVNPELRAQFGYGHNLYGPDLIQAGFGYGFGKNWRFFSELYMSAVGNGQDRAFIGAKYEFNKYTPVGSNPDSPLSDLDQSPEQNIQHHHAEVAVLATDHKRDFAAAPTLAYDVVQDGSDQTPDDHSLHLGINLFFAPNTKLTHFERAFLDEYPIHFYLGGQYDFSGAYLVPDKQTQDDPNMGDMSGDPPVTLQYLSQSDSAFAITGRAEANLMTQHTEKENDVIDGYFILQLYLQGSYNLQSSTGTVALGVKLQAKSKIKMTARP